MISQSPASPASDSFNLGLFERSVRFGALGVLALELAGCGKDPQSSAAQGTRAESNPPPQAVVEKVDWAALPQSTRSTNSVALLKHVIGEFPNLKLGELSLTPSDQDTLKKLFHIPHDSSVTISAAEVGQRGPAGTEVLVSVRDQQGIELSKALFMSGPRFNNVPRDWKDFDFFAAQKAACDRIFGVLDSYPDLIPGLGSQQSEESRNRFNNLLTAAIFGREISYLYTQANFVKDSQDHLNNVTIFAIEPRKYDPMTGRFSNQPMVKIELTPKNDGGFHASIIPLSDDLGRQYRIQK